MKLIKKIYGFLILFFFGRSMYAKFVGVKYGKNCRLITTLWGTEPFLIDIGDNVTITDGVRFLTHDGATCLAVDGKGRRYLYSKIKIGNNVFIGPNTIILPGVIIEDNVVIAAGSVVTKSIRKGSVVAGVPANKIGHFDVLINKMLNDYISERDLDTTIDYKTRVENCLNSEYKPFL